MRKPRWRWFGRMQVTISGDRAGFGGDGPCLLDAKQCRSLAEWLLRVADWLETVKEVGRE